MASNLRNTKTGVSPAHHFDSFSPAQQNAPLTNKDRLVKHFIVPFLCICLLGATTEGFAQGPGAGWRFSRVVTLNTPTTLANYQVKVTLTTAVLGNPYNNINSNGSDLRFYDNTNNVCSYWIESFNNTGTSVVWVKVTSAGATSVTMYYGNAAATAVSSGANTFDFFDDFPGNSLAPNWSHNATAGNTFAVSGGLVTLNNHATNTASSVSISSAFTPASTSFFLETKNKEIGYHRNRFYAATSLNGHSPLGFDYGYFTTQATSQTTSKIFYNGFSPTSPLSNNTYYLTRWKITDGSTYNWSTLNYATGATIDARTATVVSHIRAISIFVTEAASTSTIVDWVRVRKSQATDPTTTVGAQSPLNDNCANAFSVAPATTCVATPGSNVGASSSAGLPDQSCTVTGISRDVWYSFTADGVSTYGISVTPQSGRWSVVVYDGICGSLTNPVCAEGAAGGTVSLNAGILTAGTHYYRTYARNGVSGSFTTCVTFVSPPVLTSLGSSSGCPGTAITINGSNLSSATAVTIGGTPVSSISANSATQIVAIIGNGTTGDVVVTTAAGASNGLPFTVNPAVPTTLAYTSNPVSYCQGSLITPNLPSTGGGAPTSYSASPALPAGLSLNASTGVITGNTVDAAGTYPVTITATNSCGSTSVTLNITIISNTWIGVTSSDWNDGTNWSCGTSPDATNNVTIPSGTPNPPIVSSATGIAHDITIASGASVTVTSQTLQIGGSIINNGTLDVSNGAIEFNGTSAQAIPANVFAGNAIKDLIITNDVSLEGQDSLAGTLSFGGTNKTFTTNGNLILKSTIAGTASVGQVINGNNITGDVTVERYIATGTGPAPNHGKSWQFLAIPTTGPQTINEAWQEGCGANINCVPHYGTQITGAGGIAAGFDVATSTPSMKTFNYRTSNYDGVASTHIPIYNQEGYFVFVRGDRGVITSTAPANPTTLRTRGTLFTPANPPPVITIAADSFQSAGNPYASALDMRNITKSSAVNDVFQVWDPRLGGASSFGAFQTFIKNPATGDYEVNPGNGSYGEPGSVYNFIESGQAFIVQTTGGSGTVTFTESAKSGGSALFTRPVNTHPEMPKTLRTSLYAINIDGSASLVDGVVTNFDNSYSNGVDQFDARKSFNMDENLSIRTAGQLLAVERRQNVTQGDTIFLTLAGTKVQAYRFRFEAIKLNTGIEGFLVDNYLHTRTLVNLNGSTVVNFNVTNVAGSYAPDRFRIVFAAAGDLPVKVLTGNPGQRITVSPNPITGGMIQLKFVDQPQGRYGIRVLNKLGQVVVSKQITHVEGNDTETTQWDNNLAHGIYQLEVTNPDQSKKQINIVY